MTDFHDDEALKKLARAVIATAIRDHRRAVSQSQSDMRDECAQFLCSQTLWHLVLDLNPDHAAMQLHGKPLRRVSPPGWGAIQRGGWGGGIEGEDYVPTP